MKKKQLNTMELAEISSKCGLLSDPTRLKIMNKLQEGPAWVKDIIINTSFTITNIVWHHQQGIRI